MLEKLREAAPKGTAPPRLAPTKKRASSMVSDESGSSRTPVLTAMSENRADALAFRVLADFGLIGGAL